MAAKRSLWVWALALSFVAGLALPRPAEAGDAAPVLTGTWEGKNVCKGFDGVKFTFECCPTMEISQVSPTEFNLRLPPSDTNGEFFYFGRTIPDAVSPETKGEVAFVGCPTDNTLPGSSEMGRAKVKVSLDTKGTFTGQSIFFSDFPEIDTCKWKYDRVSTDDPSVPACGD